MKEHLPLLKETLQFMVQQLRGEDKLCLVTFDHEVRVELPLTGMDSSGKQLAEKAISSIKERGHTNLSGGLLAALETLYRIPSTTASLVESVLLFTDGKANVGIKDSVALVKATKSLLGQINRQACVFTFGYGSEHDADSLHAIAEAGNGLFYYIDNSDSIPESFCDCLGGLLSVAAQNVRLTIKAIGDCQVSKPLTTFKTEVKEPNKVFEVSIPDIYCEEEKCILAKVKVPADPNVTEALTLPLVSCHVEFFDVLNCKPNTRDSECTVVRNVTVPKPVHSDYYDEIDLHKLRCEVAEKLESASNLATRGDIPGARDLLTKLRGRIRKSVVFRKPLGVHLVETVDESLGGLQDKTTYTEHGRAVMRNYIGSHWQQRSAMKPSIDGYIKSKSSSKSSQVPPPPPVGGASHLAPPFLASASAAHEDSSSPYRISSKDRMVKLNKFSKRS